MQKTNPEQLKAIEGFIRKTSNIPKPIEQTRAELEAQARNIPLVGGVKISNTLLAGMRAEIITPDAAPADSPKTVLYIHGGGFTTGTCNTYRDIAARIAAASGVRTVTFEYRLAPEYRYPAANKDCLEAYHALTGMGITPDDIIVGGDSAGGYLALALLLSLRKSKAPLPKAAFFLSPHTEMLNFDGSSYETRAELDPSSNLSLIREMAGNYFGTPDCSGDSDSGSDISGAASHSPDIAVLSPLNEDLSGLPDLFIQVGDHEVILDDSVRLAEYAKKYGVHVTLEIWENMWHIFRFMAYMLPEGQLALNHVGAFVSRLLNEA